MRTALIFTVLAAMASAMPGDHFPGNNGQGNANAYGLQNGNHYGHTNGHGHGPKRCKPKHHHKPTQTQEQQPQWTEVPVESATETPAETPASSSAASEVTPTETPVESAPVEPTPSESAPVESAPVESAPVESAPVESAPVESAPVESAPVESAPVETAVESAPTQEATPVESAPAESATVAATPVESAPVESAPVESAPVESAPVETPVESAPTQEPTPVESAPVEEATPVESAPVEPTPVQNAPAKAAPTESTDSEDPFNTHELVVGEPQTEPARELLQSHNEERAWFGAAPLEWDDGLAQTAAAWGQQCQWLHSGSGENLAMATFGADQYGPTDLFRMWADEVVNYNWDAPSATPNNADPAAMVGHWTQIVWKGTTRVGCAYNRCAYGSMEERAESLFVVCHYDPAGNVGTGAVPDPLYAENVGTGA